MAVLWFVPAAGNCNDGAAQNRGNECNLWSSSLNSDNAQNAVNGNFNADGNANVDNDNRYNGNSVRGVAAAAQIFIHEMVISQYGSLPVLALLIKINY